VNSSIRRAALAACVALLLVTAGCTGGANPANSGTATSVTTSAPTTTSAWSNASVDQYPPGVADDGMLVNATALLDAHFAATADQSVNYTTEWSDPDRSYVRTYARGPNRTPYYSTDTDTSFEEPVTRQLYATAEQTYFRMSAATRTLTRVRQHVPPTKELWGPETVVGPRETLSHFLNRGNYSVNGSVERGGETLVRLDAREGTSLVGESLAEYEGRLLVTPEGVVEEVDESFGTGANDTADGRSEGSVTVDTSSEWAEPSWLADVPRLSVSLVEDGRAVEIRNTGGATLSANATFRVFGREAPIDWGPPAPFIDTGAAGNVTPGSLAPGEAVYVTAGADGAASSFALHDDPTAGEYAFGSASVRGGHQNLTYQLQTGFAPSQADDEAN